MKQKHTDHEYEAELDDLQTSIVHMGRVVQEMLDSSVRALVDGSDDIAQATIERDQEVNRLEVEIDDLCLRILARRQPVASDLRFVTIALKVVTDLERVGDLCVNMSERAIELNQHPALKPYMDLTDAAAAARSLLHDAVEALINRDADAARRMIERDRIVDAYHAQIFRELLTYMMEDPRNIFRATRIQGIAKSIERIGDHAINIAEMVVFMVQGKDIRHAGRMEGTTRQHLPHGIMFVCRENAARSQMAAAWARKLLPPSVNIWSAGSQPAPVVDPYAVKVMAEVGIDIARQKPKAVSDVPLGDVDTVITVCADELPLSMPRIMRIESWDLPHPAEGASNDDERLAGYRATRDEIQRRIVALAQRTGSGKFSRNPQ